MDRRTLIVGGGAAALAAAAAGTILPAQASATDAGAATAEHARRVLNLVDADLGLIYPGGTTRRLAESLGTYASSPPRDPNANDLTAWVQQRIANLTGTNSIMAAVKDIPQTQTLLSFGFLSYTQHQDSPQREIVRSMPVPAVLANLETDFLPELLRQVEAKAKASVPFANALQTSSDHLTSFITADDRTIGPGHPTDEDIVNWVVLIIVVAIVVIRK